MNTHNDIEDVLRNVGMDWPDNESEFVDRVMNDIAEGLPNVERVEVRSRRKITMNISAALAASIALAFTCFWGFGVQSTLYAQVTAAIEKARTIQAFRFVKVSGGQPKSISKSWYEKGVGFRVETDHTVRLGNSQQMWTHRKNQARAISSSTENAEHILSMMFDELDGIARKLDDQFTRHPDADQVINGAPCQAYLLTDVENIADEQVRSGTAKIVAFLDSEVRLVRSLHEVKQGSDLIRTYTDWKYDEVIDSTLFVPDFEDGVRVVDADKAFHELFDPSTAVYSEERDGLIFAIHQISRFDDNGVYFVSSVRGTDETLQRFPTQSRRVRPGEFVVDGPARNYNASPIIPGDGKQTPRGLRLKLAGATYQGVDIAWWAMVPFKSTDSFEFETGKLKFKVGVSPRGEYAKARHMKDGVIQHLSWMVSLDVPTLEPIPQFSEIAERIYSDQEGMTPFPSKSFVLGTMEVHKAGSVNDMSSKEFVQAASKSLQSWLEE